MKVLLILICLYGSNSFAQLALKDPLWQIDTTRHIPNGSNTITVEGVTFIAVCNAILDAGFTIDKKDNELQTISTPFVRNNLWQPLIFVRIRDNKAIFRSHIHSNFLGFENSFYKENKKGKPWQNANTNGFMNIYKIAKSLNKPMEYTVTNNIVTFSDK